MTTTHTTLTTTVHVLNTIYQYRSSCKLVLDLENFINVEVTLGQSSLCLQYSGGSSGICAGSSVISDNTARALLTSVIWTLAALALVEAFFLKKLIVQPLVRVRDRRLHFPASIYHA